MAKTPSRLLAAALLAVTPLSLQAQINWIGPDGNGGNGAWNLPGNWDNGLPDSGKAAFFGITGLAPEASATVTLPGTVFAIQRFAVGHGKSARVEFASGTNLTSSGGITLVGNNTVGSGSGSAHLTFAGPSSGTATFSLASFYVGHNSGNGNTLTFSGPLTVSNAGTSFSKVGQGGGINNRLRVEAGASLTRYGLHVGTDTASISGNGVEVAGTGSRLIVNGGSVGTDSARRLLIGSFGQAQGNFLEVSGGGLVRVTTGTGETTSEINAVILGSGSGARSNFITVSGADSHLSLELATTLQIGGATSFGGNRVTVGNGGALTATGAVTIATYALNGGNNDGANRLVIENGGTLTASSSITNAGLLQLASGGVLTGASGGAATVTVGATGRFEAAGNGLGANVTTTVQSGGVLAVGLTGESGAAMLTLGSSVVMGSGSFLEMNLFASGVSDRITFSSGGLLDLAAGDVQLRLLAAPEVLTAGSWQLFNGATAFSGSFDPADMLLPELGDGLSWSFVNFNQAGQWEVAIIPEAIPEPGSLALLVIGAAFGLAWRRRRS